MLRKCAASFSPDEDTLVGESRRWSDCVLTDRRGSESSTGDSKQAWGRLKNTARRRGKSEADTFARVRRRLPFDRSPWLHSPRATQPLASQVRTKSAHDMSAMLDESKRRHRSRPGVVVLPKLPSARDDKGVSPQHSVESDVSKREHQSTALTHVDTDLSYETNSPLPLRRTTSRSLLETVGTENSRLLRFRKGDIIGKGSAGVVFKAIDDETGEMVCLKEVPLQLPSQNEKLKTEIKILSTLRHEYIVDYLGAEVKNGRVCIYQEWVAGGSIESIIQAFDGPLSPTVAAKFARHVANGLSFLHVRGVAHRDLKGANVLVTDRGVAKLSDFGTSLIMLGATRSGGGAHTMAGTPYYMAPEVLSGAHYGRKADVWSFGCLVVEMLTGDPPYRTMDFQSLAQLVLYVAFTQDPPPLDDPRLAPRVVQLLLACFAFQQEARPSALDIVRCLETDPYLHDFCAEEVAQIYNGSMRRNSAAKVLSTSESKGDECGDKENGDGDTCDDREVRRRRSSSNSTAETCINPYSRSATQARRNSSVCDVSCSL